MRKASVDQAVRAILESLPATRRRSKLEPHAALIHALRRRGRTYREIVSVLRERCGVTVALHTLHHFVHGRPLTAAPSRRRAPYGPALPSQPKPAGAPSVGPASDDVQRRIAALKSRATRAAGAEPKAFAYDDTEPLQLIHPHPAKEK
jgi:hypothetical protein